MQRTSDYENMVCDFERVLRLLNLVFEELDDAPHCLDKEEAWKAVIYCNRSEMHEAIIYSIQTIVKNQKDLLENWIKEDFDEIKKNKK